MCRVNCSILDVRTVWRLSSRTRFDKINKEKVKAENQCEKHKKSSFFFIKPRLTGSCTESFLLNTLCKMVSHVST